MEPSPDQRPVVKPVYRILHRGANSLGGIDAAIVAGLDAVEADVAWYRGRLAVRHARAIARLRLMYDAYWLGLHRGVPELAAIARATTGRIDLHLDLKSSAAPFCEAVVAVIRGEGIVATTTVSSQVWPVFQRMAELEPGLRLFHSVETPRQWDATRALIASGTITGVAVEHRQLDAARVASLRAAGVRVHAWTVDDPSRARELIGWGVHGIVSNSVSLLTSIAPNASPPPVSTLQPGVTGPAQ